MPKMSQSEHDELVFQLGQKFKPATPINREDLFSGRQSQTLEVVDAINQNGQHVLLYGERGVGKTSLANMIMFKLHNPGLPVMTPHINCSVSSTTDDLWEAILADVRYRAERTKTALPRPVVGVMQEIESGLRPRITLEMLRDVFQRLSEKMVLVIIFDEFDVLESEETKQRMAETIKSFSDRNVPATMVLVGVAENVDSLISDHRSIDRCLIQVRMPRMSRDEIEGIITESLSSIGMSIDPSPLHEISRLAKGLPHYAHLLGLHAGRRSLSAGEKKIAQSHISAAVDSAISKVHVSITGAYTKATTSTKKNALYKEVLLACALTETDDFGYFAPVDVRPRLEMILKREYDVPAFARHLHTFCEPDHGPALIKADIPNRPRFRFENALLEPFVLMKGLHDGLITEDDLRETRNPKTGQGRLF